MRPETAILPLLTAAALALTGCTQADEPDPPTSPPPQAATASPSLSPDPDPDGVLESSDPDLGFVLDDTPDLTGIEADVVDTAVVYQKEYWRTMSSNAVSPAFEVIASPEIRSEMEYIATTNVSMQVTVDGTFRTAISGVSVSGDTASVDVCDDFRDVTVTDPNGTYTSAEVGYENLVRTMSLGNRGGAWVVLTSTTSGTC